MPLGMLGKYEKLDVLGHGASGIVYLAKDTLLNRQVGHFQPEGGTASVAGDEAPFGRLLAGIRGLRLEVVDVRAKFKYASHKPREVQDRAAAGLAARGGPRDVAAREHQLRRRGVWPAAR